MPIGILGWGVYVPERSESAGEIGARIGVPAEIVEKKMGIRRRYLPGPDDHVATMAAEAGRAALERAGVLAGELDLVIFHGSEYKDRIVWSAAVNVQGRLGAHRAWAFEEAHRRNLLRPDEVVVIAAAGTGYTWSAAAIRWG